MPIWVAEIQKADSETWQGIKINKHLGEQVVIPS